MTDRGKVVATLARVALVLAFCLMATPSWAPATTFIVNTVNDGADANPDGICAAAIAAPNCTLRAAIEEANGTNFLDTINFNIGGGGAQTIVLTANLPIITKHLRIDGTTQPSFAGTPLIEINGAGFNALILQTGNSTGSTIRGLCINRALNSGIRIEGSSTNVIAGNFIGTNLAGTAAGPGNGAAGIAIGGNSTAATDDNIIGGTVAADRNVISGNLDDGIQMQGGTGGAANNIIQGNYIGTDVTGTVAIPNANQGFAVFAAAGGTNTTNTVGGTAALAGNVISGNGGFGVAISSGGTTGTLVQGNKIGTRTEGTGVPNGGTGVRFDAGTSNNTVGGTAVGAGNVIAFNNSGNTAGGGGVILTAAAGSGNSILGNAIHSNTGLGIDLNEDGVTANDAAPDADSGPNNLQNYPVLTAAMTNGLGTFANFAGSLDSAASTTYRIEFFASAAADPSGFGEGGRYLGFTSVNTNAAGTVTFGLTLPVNVAAGEFVTATATNIEQHLGVQRPHPRQLVVDQRDHDRGHRGRNHDLRGGPHPEPRGERAHLPARGHPGHERDRRVGYDPVRDPSVRRQDHRFGRDRPALIHEASDPRRQHPAGLRGLAHHRDKRRGHPDHRRDRPAARHLREHDPRTRHQPFPRGRHPLEYVEQRGRRELPGNEPGRHRSGSR